MRAITGDPNIIQEKDFDFEVYQPLTKGEGDSGTLWLATNIRDDRVQYVIKTNFDSVPASEFIYHKVAAAMGLYTQEVKLIKRFRDEMNACAVKFCPEAVRVGFRTKDAPHFTDFVRFHALYALLGEDDSEEYHTDARDYLFKLDNAEAFKLFSAAEYLIRKAKTKSQWLTIAYNEKLEWLMGAKIANQDFALNAQFLLKTYGGYAVWLYLKTFLKFAALDLTALDEAFASLDKVYPKTFSEYLRRFIETRQTLCREFVGDCYHENPQVFEKLIREKLGGGFV